MAVEERVARLENRLEKLEAQVRQTAYALADANERARWRDCADYVKERLELRSGGGG